MFWIIIGGLAATLTMFSFVPQIVKSLKTRSVKDVSEVTLFQLSLGVFLWIIYGTHLKNAVIIIANVVTLATLAVLIFLYFKYGGKKA